MYLVSVRSLLTGKRVAFLRFAFGEWKEIGFWLNEQEFIEPHEYRVTVSFIRENEYRQVRIFNKEEGQ